MTFEHPPTPPAIPTDAKLSGGTFALYPETLTFVNEPSPEDQARFTSLNEKMRELQMNVPLPSKERMELLLGIDPAEPPTVVIFQTGMSVRPDSAAEEVRTILEGNWPAGMREEPVDFHSMSIGQQSVAEMLEASAA